MAFFDKLQGKNAAPTGKLSVGGEKIEIRFGTKPIPYKDKATGLDLEVKAEGVCKAEAVSVPETDVKGYANKTLITAIENEMKALTGVTIIETLPNKIPAFEKLLANKLNKSGFKDATVKLHFLDMTDTSKNKYSSAKK